MSLSFTTNKLKFHRSVAGSNTPTEPKKSPVFRVNEFGLKVQLSDLFSHLFRQTISYLISFPLTMGEGWDGGGRLGPFPPHLNPPPPWGEEVIFFAQLGFWFPFSQKKFISFDLNQGGKFLRRLSFF
jgi:hypothetical protein